MDKELVVSLVKERLGLTSSVRDAFLTRVVDGILTEISDEKGLTLDDANPSHLMFVVDYAMWRYKGMPDGSSGAAMPRPLQYRLHNLMIHVGSSNLRVDAVLTVGVLPAAPADYTVYILTADGSQQMYIDGAWTAVEMVDGQWRVMSA